MHAGGSKHSRQDVVKLLITSFEGFDIGRFGPKSEEKEYLEGTQVRISKDDQLRSIREDMQLEGDGLSDLADVHPAWISKALENESPKIIGIILRWLPSRHVRYILEHLPKRTKMALPKLVESFAVPTEVLRLIRQGFERKFSLLPKSSNGGIKSFEDICLLKPEELTVLLRDIGLQELAMAFQNVEALGIKVLLNRMSVSSARALQQRMKDTAGIKAPLLKDARYTILEVALDQEDIEKLLIEIGLAALSKGMKDQELFNKIQLKLDPELTFLAKRFVDQHVGVNKLALERQEVIMERLELLSKAGEIRNMFIG